MYVYVLGCYEEEDEEEDGVYTFGVRKVDYVGDHNLKAITFGLKNDAEKDFASSAVKTMCSTIPGNQQQSSIPIASKSLK